MNQRSDEVDKIPSSVPKVDKANCNETREHRVMRGSKRYASLMYLNLPHLQKGDSYYITKDDISKENLNFLEKEYEQDYKIFGEYFN